MSDTVSALDAAASAAAAAAAAVTAVPWQPPSWLEKLHDPWLLPVTRRGTLVEQGYTDGGLREQRTSGVLARPRFGAYCSGPEFAQLDERGRHAVRSRAVLMQADVELTLSHGSSAIWFGGPEWGLDLTDVNATRHDHRAGRRGGGVRQHRGEILSGDVLQLHDMTLMSPCRTGLELTMVAPAEVSHAQLCHLLHKGLTSKDELWTRGEAMKEWPGSLNTDVVIRLANEKIETLLEARFFYRCFRNSLPMPEPQWVVENESGVPVARLDFAWPQLGKYVECDGLVKYGKLLRPGESATDVVVREKEREKLVKRLTGMECDRFTWAEVENERHMVARVRALLGL